MRIIIIPLLAIILSCSLSAQKNYVTAMVDSVEIQSTGKCHNSYYFTFHINEVIKGKTKNSIVNSCEIYNDFGGGHLIQKIKHGDIIIKYKKDTSMYKDLIWACEKSRYKSYLKLENEVLKVTKNNRSIYSLLREDNGTLLFYNKGKLMKAYEYYPGKWKITEHN